MFRLSRSDRAAVIDMARIPHWILPSWEKWHDEWVEAENKRTK